MKGMLSAYTQNEISVHSEAIRFNHIQSDAIRGQSEGNQTHLCLLSEGLQLIYNQMQSEGNQTHLCLLSEGLQQIIGAHARRRGDDRARPDHRSAAAAAAAAAAAIVPQLPLTLIFETLRRCVHGACAHVVVGRQSVAISMHLVAIQPRTCAHVVAGILFAAIRWPSVAIRGHPWSSEVIRGHPWPSPACTW